jgi:hypothetical protein
MTRRISKRVPRRVAVCVEKRRGYGRGVLRGIADFFEAHWPLVARRDGVENRMNNFPRGTLTA